MNRIKRWWHQFWAHWHWMSCKGHYEMWEEARQKALHHERELR